MGRRNIKSCPDHLQEKSIMINDIMKVYHLWPQCPAAFYSTFTLREMKLAVQLSYDGKESHFIKSISKQKVYIRHL